MDKTILVVDDDASIREVVSICMRREGFEVIQAKNGMEALDLYARTRVDLVILDVMMEGYSGFEVCSAIRDRDISLPIIMLSAKNDLVDKGLRFKLGADDYVTKPFEPAELVMRVHSCLRNRQPGSEGGPGGAQPGRAAAIALGDLTIDPESRQACARGRRLDLTAKEFDILLLLAQRPNTVFTRQQILDSVWGYGHHGNTGVVAVFIRKLREKIEEDPSKPSHIITEWGVGYRIV